LAWSSVHTAIGIFVLVCVSLQIVWRLTNHQPDDVPVTRLEHMAFHVVHLVPYGNMIGMPLKGHLGYGRSSNLFFVVEMPPLQNTWMFWR
jgi:cytochrome b561